MAGPHKYILAAAKSLSLFLPLSQTQSSKDQQREFRNERRKVKVREGKHIFVPGKTGSGKTYAIKSIIQRKLQLEPFLNVYHLDTKKRGDFSSRDGAMIAQAHAPLPFMEPFHRMVWQPFEDNADEYTKFFLGILNAGLPAIVNIDEAINLNFNGSTPRGLSILLAQARLPGISVISGTQEIARCPRQLLSQASHLLVFNLLNDYDARMARKYLRKSHEKDLNLKRYEFWSLRPDEEDEATLFTSIEQLIPSIK